MTLAAVDGTVLASVVTAVAGALGWYVLRRIGLERDARRRHIRALRTHAMRQIEELYGPLFSLVQQLYSLREVKTRLLAERTEGGLDAAGRGALVRFLQDEYFFPIHRRMRRILETRLFLLNEAEVPASIGAYIEHSSQEIVQAEGFRRHALDTSFAKGLTFPDAFRDYVAESLSVVKRRIDDCEDDLARFSVFGLPKAPSKTPPG